MTWHFFLIVPDKAIKGERMFSLMAVGVHPHQAFLSSLDEVVLKLMLPIDHRQ